MIRNKEIEAVEMNTEMQTLADTVVLMTSKSKEDAEYLVKWFSQQDRYKDTLGPSVLASIMTFNQVRITVDELILSLDNKFEPRFPN